MQREFWWGKLKEDW